MLDHRACGRACAGRDERRDPAAQHPAGGRARDGERARLGEGVELHLPAARAEPGQAPTRVGDVAAERGSGQDREREEQRAAFSAQEEQAARGGARRRCCSSELIGRRDDLELVGARLDLCRQPADLVGERVDVPGVQVAAAERQEPGIRPVERLQLGRGGQARRLRSRSRPERAAVCDTGSPARPVRWAAWARRTGRSRRPASTRPGRPRSGAVPSSTGSAPSLSGAGPRSATARRWSAAGPRPAGRSGRGRSPRAG